MASIVAPFPAPVIVGPYSKWPRERARSVWKRPAAAGASAAAVATANHCLGPILV